MRILFIIFISFLILVPAFTHAEGERDNSYVRILGSSGQSLHILLSTFKIPGMSNSFAVDISVYFLFEEFPQTLQSDISYVDMEISTGILQVWFKEKVKDVDSVNPVKYYFENLTGFSFGPGSITEMDHTTKITYHLKNSSDLPLKKERAIEDFYHIFENYSYAHIFTQQYLDNLEKNRTEDFMFLFHYEMDEDRIIKGRIEFSMSNLEEYMDGMHTYDILKILNLSELPPGEVIIEGNAHQTYRHTDFYFKGIETNVPYTVKNTTYYNITKAFEVHIDARENITQLIISFETKENYNWEDFITDYGGYIICGSAVIIPAAVIIFLLYVRKKKMDNRDAEEG